MMFAIALILLLIIFYFLKIFSKSSVKIIFLANYETFYENDNDISQALYKSFKIFNKRYPFNELNVNEILNFIEIVKPLANPEIVCANILQKCEIDTYNIHRLKNDDLLCEMIVFEQIFEFIKNIINDANSKKIPATTNGFIESIKSRPNWSFQGFENENLIFNYYNKKIIITNQNTELNLIKKILFEEFDHQSNNSSHKIFNYIKNNVINEFENYFNNAWNFYAYNNQIKYKPLNNNNNSKLVNTIQNAESGDPQAQYILGSAYYNGIDLPIDYNKSFEWYEKAALQGHIESQEMLGLMYSAGQGVKKNDEKAFEWYNKVALKTENKDTQFIIGTMYYYGRGVAQDNQKAFEWFEKAANNDSALAQCMLGVIYSSNQIVPQDYLKSLNWFEKASLQNDSDAQYYMAQIYLLGLGVPKNEQKAFEWFEKASINGNVSAQAFIGSMYFEGIGTPPNCIMAYAYFYIAAVNGNEKAKTGLTIVKSIMDYEQIENANNVIKMLYEKMKNNHIS